MPLKSKIHRPHHSAHKNERRSKRFLKVYAPYIPLLLIVGCGLFLSTQQELSKTPGQVKSYATDIADEGLLTETNNMRAQEGLAVLTFNEELDKAAQAKAEDMSKHDYWSHNTPDGQQPWDFILKDNYNYSKAAENLAYGFSSSKAVVAGWMNSSGHRVNILDTNLSNVGFGVVNAPNYQGTGPQTVVVAMYGKPSSDLAGASALNTHAAPEPKKISFLQSITANNARWSSFVAGIAIGAAIAYLFVKYARVIRRQIKQGEKFVISHPLFDATLIAFLALATILSQTIGIIY